MNMGVMLPCYWDSDIDDRSDYPDPALAWTGVKNSGRGCTMGKFGFEQFIRYSSRNYKTL